MISPDSRPPPKASADIIRESCPAVKSVIVSILWLRAVKINLSAPAPPVRTSLPTPPSSSSSPVPPMRVSTPPPPVRVTSREVSEASSMLSLPRPESCADSMSFRVSTSEVSDFCLVSVSLGVAQK